MDHDSLVYRLLHKTACGDEYQIFIFYDYKKSVYSIRGSSYSRCLYREEDDVDDSDRRSLYTTSNGSYAFETIDSKQVFAFVHDILAPHRNDGKLYGSIIAIKDLPKHYKDITYNLLDMVCKTMRSERIAIVSKQIYEKGNLLESNNFLSTLNVFKTVYRTY